MNETIERMVAALQTLAPLELTALTLFREQPRDSGRWMPHVESGPMLVAVEELTDYREACDNVMQRVAQLKPIVLDVPCPEFGL